MNPLRETNFSMIQITFRVRIHYLTNLEDLQYTNMARLILIPILLLFQWTFGQFKSDVQANFWTRYFIDYQADTTESVGVFVKGSYGDALQFVEQHNGIYRGSVNGWQYIRIPGNSMKDLVVDKRFQYVDFAPYKGIPMNDTMRVNNRINQVQQGIAPLSQGYTGQGVAMGFIDTGIDFMHGDFRDANNKTRILMLWDQSLGNSATYTPSQYGYGRHWTGAQINAGLCTNNDQYGHGSTVAGAGCGNGMMNGTHKGVASESNLIVVESKFNASDWLATVVDATEYIYSYADVYGMPCSINASVGTYLGSHDGLDPYALYIDSLINAKPGRLFTASAGNSGDYADYHLHVDVNSDTSFSWFTVNPSSAFGGAAAFWELWADTADFNLVNYAIGADMVDPSYSFRGRTNFYNIADNLNVLIEDTIWSPNNDRITPLMIWAEQRDGQYLVQVLIQDPDSSDYLYRFETVGSGSYDCWSIEPYGMSKIVEDIPTVSQYDEMSKYVLPDSLQSIVSSFQCSPNVIAVGNYANDSGFVNMYGNWMNTGWPRGELYLTSSIGPNRLGNVKPEIVASGHGNMSSAPSHVINDYFNTNKDTLLAYGGKHMPNGGTSMASPVVAGVGALLLQKCPSLTQSEFINIITSTAYQDNFTGSNLPNYGWGYGKIDGFAAVTSTKFKPQISGDTTFCEGGNTTIMINGSGFNVEWEDGSTSFSDVFIDSANTFFTSNDYFGCQGDTVWVNVIEYPNPSVPSIYVQYDSLISTGGFQEYSWMWNGLPFSSTGMDSVLVVSDNGNYLVTVTDAHGCTSNSSVFQYGSAELQELTSEFKIYPNPTNNILNIESDNESFSIAVLDELGRTIINPNEMSNRYLIDLSNYSNGVYWVHIFTANNSVVQKIVLNK